MFLEQLIVIASVTFLCMVSPGPDMIIVMRNTFYGGRDAGFDFVYALERPLVKRFLDRGQRLVNGMFGILLISADLRVAASKA